MPLSTSTAMITVPDWNCRHMIVSALSLRSRRAAGGLRQPSESRVLLAFMARATCCRCAGPAKRPLAFDQDYASKRRSTEDPKSMALTTGIQGIGPSASCWRRRIPSTSLSVGWLGTHQALLLYNTHTPTCPCMDAHSAGGSAKSTKTRARACRCSPQHTHPHTHTPRRRSPRSRRHRDLLRRIPALVLAQLLLPPLALVLLLPARIGILRPDTPVIQRYTPLSRVRGGGLCFL